MAQLRAEVRLQFPAMCSGCKGSGIATVAAQVTAVVGIQSLAWEFPMGVAIKKKSSRSSLCGAVETNLTSIREDAVRSLASLSGLRIWHCRSQTWLGSHMVVAVAVVSSCNS